jgi:L-threonylcarbamoyladenylate synthase
MGEFEQDIEHCLTVLEQGGTILYPTDTVWGIGCDATNPAAVEKVFAIKERPFNRSMIVLVAEEKDLLKYVAAPDPHIFDFLKRVTRPTTVIYNGAVGLAPNVLHENGSVAIRVVQDKFCRHLIKRFRKPIVSTSANISGDPTPKKFTEILNHIVKNVDYVVTYRQDDLTEAEASVVVKLERDGSPTYIRQ